MIQRRLVDPVGVHLLRQLGSLRSLRLFRLLVQILFRVFYVVIHVIIFLFLHAHAFECRGSRPLRRRRRRIAFAPGDGCDEAAVAGPGQGAVAVVEVDGIALAQCRAWLPAELIAGIYAIDFQGAIFLYPGLYR
jgi:hypothetical protein